MGVICTNNSRKQPITCAHCCLPLTQTISPYLVVDIRGQQTFPCDNRHQIIGGWQGSHSIFLQNKHSRPRFPAHRRFVASTISPGLLLRSCSSHIPRRTHIKQHTKVECFPFPQSLARLGAKQRSHRLTRARMESQPNTDRIGSMISYPKNPSPSGRYNISNIALPLGFRTLTRSDIRAGRRRPSSKSATLVTLRGSLPSLLMIESDCSSFALKAHRSTNRTDAMHIF